MAVPAKRRDYNRNVRKKYDKRSGCMWCGREGFGRIPQQSEYCSDACLQADMAGIDDIPPVVPCGDPAGMSEEAKSRAIQRMNDSYNDWAASRVGRPSDDGDTTGGGPYTPGSAIEEFGGDDEW